MFRGKNRNKDKQSQRNRSANTTSLDIQYLAVVGSGLLGKGKKSKSGLSYNSSYYNNINPLSFRTNLSAPEYGNISEKDAKYLSNIKVPDRHIGFLGVKLKSVLDFSLRTNTLNIMVGKVAKFLEYRNAGSKEKKESINELQSLFAPHLGVCAHQNDVLGSYVNPGKLSYMQHLLA